MAPGAVDRDVGVGGAATLRVVLGCRGLRRGLARLRLRLRGAAGRRALRLGLRGRGRPAPADGRRLRG